MSIIHLSKMTGTAGSEGHLLVLLDGLRQHGVDARLWILVEPDNPVQDYVDRATAHGIPTERIPIRHHFDPGLWGQLTARLRAAAPTLVHTHLIHADLYGIPAARHARVRHVVSSRHNDDKFRRKLPARLLLRWLWQQTDTGIAISEAIRQFSIEVEGAPADRIHTIHYGLDPESIQATERIPRGELGIPPTAPVVGSVCRLIEQKGISYGLRAFAQIADRVPDAHYVIAGDGPLRGDLESEAHALGISQRVHFIGWQNAPYTALASSDVLLAPSLWEGFGLVFLEAMALSVPVISTQISAIPEVVVDGETGWLVPPCDADALAGALHSALTQPDNRRERGANGRHRLETQFTVDQMIQRTLAVYHSLEANG